MDSTQFIKNLHKQKVKSAFLHLPRPLTAYLGMGTPSSSSEDPLALLTAESLCPVGTICSWQDTRSCVNHSSYGKTPKSGLYFLTGIAPPENRLAAVKPCLSSGLWQSPWLLPLLPPTCPCPSISAFGLQVISSGSRSIFFLQRPQQVG